ncbi:hypothetical protein POM88_037906 [Heracleum sosnowskyi]|uniref:Uncharacterized protein n=1 Tax=Heracleum sosnowskyi TaxID=360622 RepID=A0AAD8HR03_9APIA|nr:hypothetical protein POM88_037906 [Heracleum sosnowskyi]
MGGKCKGDQKGKEKKVAPTWQEKKAVIDREEDAIEQELEEQKEWIAMMRDIDNEEMKCYLGNRPDHLKAKNLEKRGKEEEMLKVLQPTTQGARCGCFKEMATNIVA